MPCTVWVHRMRLATRRAPRWQSRLSPGGEGAKCRGGKGGWLAPLPRQLVDHRLCLGIDCLVPNGSKIGWPGKPSISIIVDTYT
jgi:hypothetical protein